MSPPVSCPCGRLSVTLAPPRPLAGVSVPVPCPSLALALSPLGVVVVGWGGGLWGADGPCLGMGGLEPPAEGLGGVGWAEALDGVPEEGFSCRLRHGSLQGGLIGVGRGAGADLLEGVHYVHPSSPSCSPGPLHPAAELPQSGDGPPGEVGGGLGGGGFRAQGPGAAVAGAGGEGWVRAAGGTGRSVRLVGGGSIDLGRRWRAWRRPRYRERRLRGLGMEDAYGRRGEREARCCSRGQGNADIGRRWCAWRRPGEREQRWRGLGVEDAYGRRGERDAQCCSRGEGDVDMGQRWRAWWHPGEQERRERGPGGSWWRLGERERRELAAEAR